MDACKMSTSLFPKERQSDLKKNNLYTLNQKEYWKLKYLPYIAIQIIGVVQV